MARPRPSQMPFTSDGEPSKGRGSFSKISTPSNPTAAAACSFSGKEPLRQTVAIALGRGVKGVVIVAQPQNGPSMKTAHHELLAAIGSSAPAGIKAVYLPGVPA